MRIMWAIMWAALEWVRARMLLVLPARWSSAHASVIQTSCGAQLGALQNSCILRDGCPRVGRNGVAQAENKDKENAGNPIVMRIGQYSEARRNAALPSPRRQSKEQCAKIAD